MGVIYADPHSGTKLLPHQQSAPKQRMELNATKKHMQLQERGFFWEKDCKRSFILLHLIDTLVAGSWDSWRNIYF